MVEHKASGTLLRVFQARQLTRHLSNGSKRKSDRGGPDALELADSNFSR